MKKNTNKNQKMGPKKNPTNKNQKQSLVEAEKKISNKEKEIPNCKVEKEKEKIDNDDILQLIQTPKTERNSNSEKKKKKIFETHEQMSSIRIRNKYIGVRSCNFVKNMNKKIEIYLKEIMKMQNQINKIIEVLSLWSADTLRKNNEQILFPNEIQVDEELILLDESSIHGNNEDNNFS